MFTTDFSKAPVQGRAAALVIREAARGSGAGTRGSGPGAGGAGSADRGGADAVVAELGRHGDAATNTGAAPAQRPRWANGLADAIDAARRRTPLGHPGRQGGVVWQTSFRDGRVSGELLLTASVDRAEELAAEHEARGLRALVLEAEERGYSNGVWRAEPHAAMATNERFARTSRERARDATAPLVDEPIRRTRPLASPPPANGLSIFDTGCMFVGATRYRHPLAWAITGRYWGSMTAKMRRMSGYCWHDVYWEAPWTLGTLANFRTRDDLLQFARLPEHHHLMQWIVRDTVNATAGFIRLFSTREARGEADAGAAAAASTATVTAAPGSGEGAGASSGAGSGSRSGAGSPVGPTAAPGAVGAARERIELAGGAAPTGLSAAAPTASSASSPPPVVVREAATEADLRDFIDVALRVGDRSRSVPLLHDTIRSWWRGTVAHESPVTLLVARRGREVVGRATAHSSTQLDAKLGTRAQLFGAIVAIDAGALAALVGELESRARAAGARELIGPVALLPNQTGGVIASGFMERGFMDSAWNPSWLPGAFEALGFATWNESATWIVRVPSSGAAAGAVVPAASRVAPDAFVAPSADELAGAGIRIRRGSRLRFARDVEELRRLTNAAFDELPYYTAISREQMRDATDGLVALMDPSLWLTAVDALTGEAVGFVLVIPDPTAVLQRSGGALGARELIDVLRSTGRLDGLPRLLGGGDGAPREAILIIQGVHPTARGRGISTLLGRALGAALVDGGYRALRSTYVGHDNPASARQFERMGGRPLHETVFYRRAVDRPESGLGAENATDEPAGEPPMSEGAER